MSGEVPIGQLFSQLVDDGKRYALAEVELCKAKAASKAQPIKMAAILGSAALTLVLGAVTALLVGLILTLRPILGPLPATLIVVAVTICVAALLGYLAYRQVQEARR